MNLPITMLCEPAQTEPSDGEIVSVLAAHYDVDVGEVCRWLSKFDPIRAHRQIALELGIAKEIK